MYIRRNCNRKVEGKNFSLSLTEKCVDSSFGQVLEGIQKSNKNIVQTFQSGKSSSIKKHKPE